MAVEVIPAKPYVLPVLFCAGGQAWSLCMLSTHSTTEPYSQPPCVHHCRCNSNHCENFRTQLFGFAFNYEQIMENY